MKKLYAFVFLVYVSVGNSVFFANSPFQSLDLNPQNQVLFTVTAPIQNTSETSSSDSYNTLFSVDIPSRTVEQLTHYPEKMEMLVNSQILQIRNAFGSVQYNIQNATITKVPHIDLPAIVISPDGNWITYIRPTSAALGDLFLYDAVLQKERLLASQVEINYEDIPVRWAPNSKVFLYAHNGSIYFAYPDNLFGTTALQEQYRKLGEGSINNIDWYTKDGHVYCMYVHNNEVYAISTSELVTRSLYAELIGIGTLKGKLPFTFNPYSDTFATGDGSSLMIMRNNRSVTYMQLQEDDFLSENSFSALPYLVLPASTLSVHTLFVYNSPPLVCAQVLQNGIKSLHIYQLDAKYNFIQMTIPENTIEALCSPDKKYIALSSPKGLFVYDRASWKQIASFTAERIVSYVWANNTELYIGGDETIRLWNPVQKILSTVHLSSVFQYGWNEKAQYVTIQTKNSGRFTMSDPQTKKWQASPSVLIRMAQTVNESWRVYSEGNNIYARSTAALGNTIPLLDKNYISTLTQPGIQEKKVTIIFDALDDAAGLAHVLQILKKYGITTTFFVNGEFIRRNPSAVKEIIASSHQIGSQFFSTYNLANTAFTIDEEFILRGLARTEDDFYTATGKELSLVWHTPYYISNKMITDAGEKAGYTYIQPTIYPLDWITVEDAQKMPLLYKSAAELVEEIMRQVEDTAVIPISIGQPNGTRSDFLYDKLEVLINALLKEGYDIVPLSY